MDTTPDDDTERVVRARWWVPWLVGFVASATALIALSTVFPVAIPVLAGYGSAFGAAWQRRRGEQSRAGRGDWVAVGLSIVLIVGVGLLLGFLGPPDDAQRSNTVPGAVLGGVLIALGGSALLVLVLAARRRQRASTTADDES